MDTAFSSAVKRVGEGADPRSEAAALVAEMAVDEQLGCLDGDTPFWPGLFDMTAGGYYRHPWPAAVVDRLGIPGLQFADGPRGAVIADGTAFPVSMARGALFDPALEERIGDAIGLELRASGATFTGAVCMNLLRHPAWGRAQETYGEDPHHVGRMAIGFTRGLQRHVMACMKHFAVNSMENARFSVDVTASDRALHEVYLPHFRDVADEGVASVMSAYNSLNGEWCGENETLLSTILRDEWQWPGFVISDFIFGLRDAVKSVGAGLDVEMPFRQQRAMALSDALEDGRLALAEVTLCVERIVATLLRFAHVFEHEPSADVIGCAPHRALAREAAAEATVMLANDGVLPLNPSSVRQVMVVGALADVANLGDGGSSDVKSTSVVTPLDGIRAAFGADRVHHAIDLSDPADGAAALAADVVIVVVGYTRHDEGEYIDNAGTMALAPTLFPPMDHPDLGVPPRPSAPMADSDAADDHDAPDADAAVDAGDAADDADDGSGMSPGGDRTSLRLSAADEALIVAAAATGPTVVSVQCGSAVMMPWVDQTSATLVSWYSGVEGGHALGDVLTGHREPGGRLPFAVPVSEDHLVHFDKDATAETYGLVHGQWKLDADGVPAHFAFGAGLGYTTFEIDAAEYVDAAAHIRVTNTGHRDGTTVVFVFGGLDGSEVERASRRLVGFRRVRLGAGASTSVAIPVDWRHLDVRGREGWWTESGTYQLDIGQRAGESAISLSVAR